jgi:hypothetical protein
VNPKLRVSFVVVVDLGNLAVQLLPILFTAAVDLLLLLSAEFGEYFLGDLDFEGKWDGGLLRGDVVFLRRILVVSKSGGFLLLLPAGEDDGLEGGCPGVGTICL